MGEVLTGVGVGPGDPELLTLRGLAVLREADLVLVPARDDADSDGPGHAERVVQTHLPHARLQRLAFALTDRGGLTARRTAAWEQAGEAVVAAFDAGARRIAFATVGDPNVYSTFGYLAVAVRARRPDVAVATVPGITAMQALAAASGTVLCEGREPLVLLPLRDDAAVLDAVLTARPDASVAVYKAGRSWPAVREVLARHSRLVTAVVGAHLGRDGESVTAASGAAADQPYFSTVLAPPIRTIRGGKLA
ncbi:MAG: precorrin-2 C(20)-methyltransferase [Jatrophihabitans sp.]|uniref:precorrin-2 C(20)-methyltransferase n=1 Tax=Jatrophihabitans sp. TaxID=1932789 RepID=UPI003F7FBE99